MQALEFLSWVPIPFTVATQAILSTIRRHHSSTSQRPSGCIVTLENDQMADVGLNVGHQHPKSRVNTKFTIQLEKIDSGSLKDVLEPKSGPALGDIKALVVSAGAFLNPQGPGPQGVCDRNICERCCNCASSIPYIVIGVKNMRCRRCQEGRLWGASVAGVGAASLFFHASTGRWRCLGRKLDYWTIGWSSHLLLRACYPNTIPRHVTTLSLALTPFKPFLVSTLNTLAMELKYLDQARKKEHLRGAHGLHVVCAAVGMGAFALEEVKPDIPLIHSTWHVLSALCLMTTNTLLHHVEKEAMAAQGLPTQPVLV